MCALPDDYDGLVGVARAAAQPETSQEAMADVIALARTTADQYRRLRRATPCRDVAGVLSGLADRMEAAIARAEGRP